MMSLFINEKHHKNIYKNQEKITTTNPTTFRSDPLIELLEEHQKKNDSLCKIIRDLEKKSKQQDMQCDLLDHKIKEFKKSHVEDTKHVIQRLVEIEDANQNLAHRVDVQEISDETKLFMHQAYNEIQKQLHQFALKIEGVSSNADKQLVEHKKIQEQYLEQVKKYTHSGKQLENIGLVTNRIAQHSSAEINSSRELEIKKLSCSINRTQEVKRNLKPLIRRKTFGNITQTKTRIVNKKFSKHPRIDDF